MNGKLRQLPVTSPLNPKSYNSWEESWPSGRGGGNLELCPRTAGRALRLNPCLQLHHPQRAREKWGVVPRVLRAGALSRHPSHSLDVLQSLGCSPKWRGWCEYGLGGTGSLHSGYELHLWNQKEPGSNPSFATYQSCNLRQATQAIHTSVSPGT